MSRSPDEVEVEVDDWELDEKDEELEDEVGADVIDEVGEAWEVEATEDELAVLAPREVAYKIPPTAATTITIIMMRAETILEIAISLVRYKPITAARDILDI